VVLQHLAQHWKGEETYQQKVILCGFFSDRRNYEGRIDYAGSKRKTDRLFCASDPSPGKGGYAKRR
jgi:hypothetical protein